MKHNQTLIFSSFWMVLFFLFSGNAFAKEVYKTKAGGLGPNQFKQYATLRNNANNGFIYAGTTINANGDNCIHVIKTNNTFATTWSYAYVEVNDHDLNATGICRNYAGSGYWVCGYWRDGTDVKPFIMEIDDNGNVLQHIMGEQNGVFLDIAATNDDGCAATGFVSDGISEPEPNSRRGLLSKFDDTLGVVWSRAFHAQFHASGDNRYYEVGENLLVINNANTNYQNHYFVSGSISDIYIDGTTPVSVPNLYYMYVDNAGGLIYKNTTKQYGNSFDIAYDQAEHKVYYVGKFDIKPNDYASILGKIDVAFGTVDYQKYFEGLYQGFPFPHSPVPYKIDVHGDSLFVFGYLRFYNFTGSSISRNIAIPYRAIFNKSNASEIEFFLNHADTINTAGYPSEDPGFLHAWDNYIGNYTPNAPSVYGPEMGCVYYNSENQVQWAMVGYYDQPGAPTGFDLHLINSENLGECSPVEHDLSIGDLPQQQVETIFVNVDISRRVMTISKSSVNFDDNNCN